MLFIWVGCNLIESGGGFVACLLIWGYVLNGWLFVFCVLVLFCFVVCVLLVC